MKLQINSKQGWWNQVCRDLRCAPTFQPTVNFHQLSIEKKIFKIGQDSSVLAISQFLKNIWIYFSNHLRKKSKTFSILLVIFNYENLGTQRVNFRSSIWITRIEALTLTSEIVLNASLRGSKILSDLPLVFKLHLYKNYEIYDK